MSGWIKLHRDIQNHWVFQDAEQFRAWVDLLMLANHKPKKFSIKGQLISCESGQLGVSKVTLGIRWGWHRDRVSRFLKILEKDGMITIKTTHLNSVITVCNYSIFQGITTSDTTSDTTADTTADTTQTRIKKNKEFKNEKNDKEIISATALKKSNAKNLLAEFGIDGELADDFILHRKSKKATISKTVLQGFQNEADKAGISILDAIRISIERNWQGFNADWIKEKPVVTNGMIDKAEQTKQAMINFVNEDF